MAVCVLLGSFDAYTRCGIYKILSLIRGFHRRRRTFCTACKPGRSDNLSQSEKPNARLIFVSLPPPLLYRKDRLHILTFLGGIDSRCAPDILRNLSRPNQNLNVSLLHPDILHSIIPHSSTHSHCFDRRVVYHGRPDRISSLQTPGFQLGPRHSRRLLCKPACSVHRDRSSRPNHGLHGPLPPASHDLEPANLPTPQNRPLRHLRLGHLVSSPPPNFQTHRRHFIKR